MIESRCCVICWTVRNKDVYCNLLTYGCLTNSCRMFWYLPLETVLLVREVLLKGWLMLEVLDMFTSCSRMLLRSLLTCSPSSSATNRRLYRLCRSGTFGPRKIKPSLIYSLILIEDFDFCSFKLSSKDVCVLKKKTTFF